MRKTVCRRFTAALAAVLFALLVFAQPAFVKQAFAEPQNKTVRIAYYPTPNYQEVTSDGAYKGFSYDYYMQIQKYTHWNYEFVQESYANCLKMLLTGEIDIMSGVTKTDARAEQMLFGSTTVSNVQNKLYARADDDEFCYESFDTFDGCCVGITTGMLTDELDTYQEKHGFTTQIVRYNSAKELEQALLNGSVDLICVSSISATADTKIVGRMARMPLYYAVNEQRPDLLNELDDALQKIIDNNPDFYTQMSEKYMISGANATATFTREELDYIASNPMVYLIINPDWEPISSYNEKESRYEGIFIDVAKLVAQYSGLDIQFCTEKEFNDIAQKSPDALNNVVAILADDNSWAVAQNVMMTNHVVDTSVVMVTKTGTNFAHISEDGTIALPNGFYIGYIMRGELSGRKVKYFDTVEKCLDAVNSGDADAAYVNELTARYYSSLLEYNNLYAAANSGYHENLAFAVNKDSNSPLLTIIDKSLLCIGNKEINEIITRNSVATERFSLKGVYASNPQFFSAILCAIVIAAAGAVFAIAGARAKRRRAEARLVEESETISARTDFFMMISHEVRTPLNAIVGYLRLAGENCKNDSTAAEYIKRSQNAALQLTAISEDMLDYARIASDKVELRSAMFDIKKVVRNVDENISIKATKKDINYRFDVSGIEHEYVIGDNLRFAQIMQNVMDNAIKFTDEKGTVHVSVTEKAISDEKIELAFICKDTGKGMSKEFLDKICAPFNQSDHAYSRTHGGLGLGLYLTKFFVDAMGGTLDVQSAPGEGSTFTITIPFERPHSSQIFANKVSCAHVRAIIGCENEDEGARIASLLKRLEIKCDIVDNAKTLLRRITGRMNGEYYYSLCVIDESLLKESKTLAQDILKLALPPSIFVMTADVVNSTKALQGCNVQHILYKPIFQSVLFDAVINTFGDYASTTKETTAPSLKGINALVVEDNALNADILTRVLNKADITVKVCENGQIAVDEFTLRPTEYNIVFMDIQMPVMNGYEATKCIRALPQGKDVPIIAVSANAFPEDIEKSHQSGMNEHISKPVDVDKLYVTIQKYCIVNGGDEYEN